MTELEKLTTVFKELNVKYAESINSEDTHIIKGKKHYFEVSPHTLSDHLTVFCFDRQGKYLGCEILE